MLAACAVVVQLLIPVSIPVVAPPTDDPVATFFSSSGASGVPAQRLDSSWFPWNNVVTASVAAAAADPAQAYATAAAAVLKSSPLGGVVYFPPATYTFIGTLPLVDRVILRGAPTGFSPASNGPKGPGPLAPSTVFNFPDRSYSRISCTNCTVSGVIDILSDGAGVSLSQRDSGTAQASHRTMFLVLDNVLRHVAYKYPVAPPATFYQEWPYRFTTAVAVAATENALIANNLLTKATRSTKVKVSFLPVEDVQTGHALSANRNIHENIGASKSCSASIMLHQNFTLDVNKGVRSEAMAVDATGDMLTSACCERCLNNTFCIGFQAHQTGKHSNCITYECPTDGSPNCKLALVPWVPPKKPTHKNEPSAVGLWSGQPRPKLPPKHPPKPPHPPPGPPHPHPPPGPPHPHPPPPPKDNCSLNVAFAYDNRYGIWHTRPDPSMAVVNVSIINNYVHQNGRVGITWQSNDGSGTAQTVRIADSSAAVEDARPDPTEGLGEGVVVYGNHVEVEKDSVLWSVTGTKLAHGASTNENRGYDQSGHSATDPNSGTWFEKNTGAIHRQFTPSGCTAGSYLTTDGEGLLQQIQDGEVAERNIWKDNDFTFGSSGYMGLYGLHAVLNMQITGNQVLSNEKIGLYQGGSTPKNSTGISDVHCSGNTPPAICR